MATTHIEKSTPNANTAHKRSRLFLGETMTANSIRRLTWHGLSALIAVHSRTHSLTWSHFVDIIFLFVDFSMSFSVEPSDAGRGCWKYRPYGDVIQNGCPLSLAYHRPELIQGSFHFVSNKMVRQFFFRLLCSWTNKIIDPVNFILLAHCYWFDVLLSHQNGCHCRLLDQFAIWAGEQTLSTKNYIIHHRWLCAMCV